MQSSTAMSKVKDQGHKNVTFGIKLRRNSRLNKLMRLDDLRKKEKNSDRDYFRSNLESQFLHGTVLKSKFYSLCNLVTEPAFNIYK